MRRVRKAVPLAVLAGVALTSCAGPATTVEASPSASAPVTLAPTSAAPTSAAPAGASPAASSAPASASARPSQPSASPTQAGGYLTAAGEIFDPAFDVEDERVCNRQPGRTVLEEFDRVEWPEFGIPAGDGLMTCGHDDSAGWRHIADGHTDDYDEIAVLVDADWEDVAWWVIDLALEEPTRVEMYADDIANYLLELEYIGEDGRVEQRWLIVVGVGLTTEKIITSFPKNVR